MRPLGAGPGARRPAGVPRGPHTSCCVEEGVAVGALVRRKERALVAADDHRGGGALLRAVPALLLEQGLVWPAGGGRGRCRRCCLAPRRTSAPRHSRGISSGGRSRGRRLLLDRWLYLRHPESLARDGLRLRRKCRWCRCGGVSLLPRCFRDDGRLERLVPACMRTMRSQPGLRRDCGWRRLTCFARR